MVEIDPATGKPVGDESWKNDRLDPNGRPLPPRPPQPTGAELYAKHKAGGGLNGAFGPTRDMWVKGYKSKS